MPVVTLNGSGRFKRIVRDFASLGEAVQAVVDWCVANNDTVTVTADVAAYPDWGLPVGGTYQLIVYPPDAGECGWSLSLLSEGPAA